MRKAFASIFILLLGLSCIWAANVSIIPYSGANDVNIASVKFQGTFSGFKGSGSNVWTDENLSAYDSEKSKSYYCDEHMVAAGGVYGVDDSESGKKVSITVNCASGFYFRSLSHPNSIRPFELILVPRYNDGRTGNPITGYNNVTRTGEPIVFNDSFNNKSRDIPYTFASNTPDKDIWFDIVLVLPLDETPISNSNYIEAYGRRYALMPAEDYTAIVEITVEWPGAETQKLIIPFSGYYTGTTNDTGEEVPQSVSFQVSTTAAASNLTISNQGNPRVEIGAIDFILNPPQFEHIRDWEIGDMVWNMDKSLYSVMKYDDDYTKIFLSSSNDPYDTDADEFQLVHTSVMSGQTPMTNYNHIGFDIYVDGDEGKGTNDGENEPSGTQNVIRQFTGTDNVSSGDVSNAIIPIRVRETNTHVNNNRYEYFKYSGKMYVQIDTPVSTMLPGSYMGNVYVHVVSDETKVNEDETVWRDKQK